MNDLHWVTGKPTSHGWYWLKSYHTNLVTKAREVTDVGIVFVCQGSYRRKAGLQVIGKFWRAMMEEIPVDDQWAGPIETPQD